MPSRGVAFIFAEGVAIDQFTARITYFNTLDYVFAKAIPAQLPRLIVGTMYEMAAEPEEFLERVTIRHPKGTNFPDTISLTEVGLRGRGGKRPDCTHHSIHFLSQVAFHSEGDYTVTVERQPKGAAPSDPWDKVMERSLIVAVRAHPLFQP